MRKASALRLLVALLLLVLGIWAIVWVYWLNEPVTLPDVREPIPVLNQDKTIAIGEPIRLLVTVDKPMDVEAERASRSIVCESGNLVTLTPSTRDLPTGQFTIVFDDVDLPPKVEPGDVCQFRFNLDYRINPIRIDERVWFSEEFTVASR